MQLNCKNRNETKTYLVHLYVNRICYNVEHDSVGLQCCIAAYIVSMRFRTQIKIGLINRLRQNYRDVIQRDAFHVTKNIYTSRRKQKYTFIVHNLTLSKYHISLKRQLQAIPLATIQCQGVAQTILQVRIRSFFPGHSISICKLSR